MRIRKVLYFFLISVLFLPFIQFVVPFSKSKALKGWQQASEKPYLTSKSFFEGKFQEDAEDYYKDKVGFQPDFVRVRNQTYFSLFHVCFHDKTLVGKQDCFYEKGYINNALFGMYGSSSDDIKNKSEKFFLIQDTLEKLGKEVLFVSAPGKGTYYPEYIPSVMFHVEKRDPAPHLEYQQHFDRLGIHYIDLDKYFRDLKKQNIGPLYSKNGIHWNKYGCYYAIDTLSRYFNKKYPFMPEVVLDSIVYTDAIWENEADCFESANLIQKPKKEVLPHPFFHYTQTESKRLKCIFVGDSYIWPLTLLNFNKDYFQDSQYWYYFKEVSYVDNTPHKDISEINVKQELLDADVIILMFTNATTFDFDKGFTDEVFELFELNKESKN